MMIILIISIPVTALVVGFLVLKSVQLGLRWQLQVQAKQEPTMQNPVAEIIEDKKIQKVSTNTARIFDEWINGKQDKE